MKVLHLIGGGDAGGAKSHVLSLVQALGKHIDVSLISFRPGSFAKDAEMMGIDIRIVNTGNLFGDVYNVLKIIRKEKFQLVHSHGAKANMIAVIVNAFVNVPVISTVHSDYRLDYMDSVLKEYTFGIINALALRFIPYYVAVSNNFREMLIERSFNPENIFTVYNGLNFLSNIPNYSRKEFCAKYKIPIGDNTMLVGILARLHPVKGLETFLRSAQQTLAKHPDVQFLIGGDGDEQSALEKLAENLGVSKNVHFLGFVNPYAFMSSLDINVLTSISESFPYAILEGAKLHKPTISSNVGGISDLIKHNINGYLFEAGDYNTLTKHICTLIENPDLRETFGKRIYDDANGTFSLVNMCKTQLEIYQKVIEKFPRDKEHSSSYDVIISGYYGHDNLGDDAMLASIISNLRTLKNNIRILVLSHNPLNTKKIHSVSSIERMNILKLILCMLRGKLFINGGGNLIQDNTSARSLLYYLTTIWLAKIFRMKVMLYSNGIGPLNRTLSKRLSAFILNKVDYITLRENLSLEVLNNLNVKHPKIKMTADPALSLKISPNLHAGLIYENAGIKDLNNLVAISVRKHANPNYKQTIAKAADYMVENFGATPVFVVMHFPEDLEVAQEIKSLMANPAYIIDQKCDLSTMMGLLSKAKIILGMRLHALVFGVSLGIPIIGISYEPKVKGFMDYIHQPYSIAIEKLNFNILKPLIDVVWTQHSHLHNELLDISNTFELKAIENAVIAIQLLNNEK